MAGYFGTEMQQRLQAQAEARAEFIAATPGACQAGRTMGCDDPDRLGWDWIDAALDHDGVCGFRLLSPAKAAEVETRLAERGYRFDTWDVFIADRTTALAASEAILADALPEGLVDLDAPTDPESAHTAALQDLMRKAGIVPFSGSMLVGQLGSATTVAVGDADGAVVAAAHGYLPHNAASPWRHHAWGGLVAVADAQRGKGLGRYINARMIASVMRALEATHVYELVTETNVHSRRMVAACGLRHDPGLVCGLATPLESARFTR